MGTKKSHHEPPHWAFGALREPTSPSKGPRTPSTLWPAWRTVRAAHLPGPSGSYAGLCPTQLLGAQVSRWASQGPSRAHHLLPRLRKARLGDSSISMRPTLEIHLKSFIKQLAFFSRLVSPKETSFAFYSCQTPRVPQPCASHVAQVTLMPPEIH